MSYELDFHDSNINDETLRLLHLAGPINPGERRPVKGCFRHNCFKPVEETDNPTCSQCGVAVYCSTECLERDKKLHQGLCQAEGASAAPSDKSLRRILVFHTNGKISWRWAAFRDGKLKLNISDLDDYYNDVGRVELKSDLVNLCLLTPEKGFNHGIMCCKYMYSPLRTERGGSMLTRKSRYRLRGLHPSQARVRVVQPGYHHPWPGWGVSAKGWPRYLHRVWLRDCRLLSRPRHEDT